MKDGSKPEPGATLPGGTALDRRSVLGAAGGAVLVAGWAPGSLARAAQDWKPEVFDPRQASIMRRLVEAIIPRTDTPGAADALVERFIDLQLSLSSAAEQERFLGGLSRLDAFARSTAKKRLARLDEGELLNLLLRVSDDPSAQEAQGQGAPGSDLEGARRFFADLKQRTIDGYYTSREGWVRELGLPDGPFTARYRGCSHADAEHSKARG